MGRTLNTIEANKTKVQKALEGHILSLKSRKVEEHSFKKDPVFRRLKAKLKKFTAQLQSLQNHAASRKPGGVETPVVQHHKSKKAQASEE
jgi:hypothetical protein